MASLATNQINQDIALQAQKLQMHKYYPSAPSTSHGIRHLNSARTIEKPKREKLHNHNPLKTEETKNPSFKDFAKQLFTVKRLSIVALVLVASQFLGNFIRNSLGMSQHNTSSDQVNSENYLFKEAAVFFTQILASSLLAISLENVFTKNVKFGEAIRRSFSNNSLKLALSLSAFNTFAEVGTHFFKHSNFYNNMGTAKPITDLISAIVKLVGTFSLARVIAGANSISAMFATACPCCNMPVCAIELFSLVHSLWQAGVNAIKGNQSEPG